MKKTKLTTAICIRTKMCGGGTSYDVYWPVKVKPSHPLHNHHTYATTIINGGKEYFRTEDAIDPRSHWEMDAGMEKWTQYKHIEKAAKRLNVRVAKRVFPELKGQRELPFLWASWNLPSMEIDVPVRIALPD